MELKKLEHPLTVCKVKTADDLDLSKEFYFIGKTDEEVGDEVYKRSRRANRGKRNVPGVPSDDDHIRRVEKKLQDTRRHHRERVYYYFAEQRSFDHLLSCYGHAEMFHLYTFAVLNNYV